MFIKTVSTASGINPIKFDEIGGVFYWILNTGLSTVYASTKSAFTAGDDGVVSLGPKESRRLETNNDTIYILGAGQVEIHNQRDGICSFKQAPTSSGSGGGGTIDAYSKTESDAKYASKALYEDTTINVGREAGSVVGDHSTAEGINTTASGRGSHAEGISTTASEKYSHAEGRGTTASGRGSHAEGSDTTASGIYSHAEGSETTASGKYSHAGGNLTNALHDNEVAYGKYNESNDNTLFSIGDGTADYARHNAFEITTDGGKLHDKDIATTDLIPNPNLLINPDFKINQRGLSSYNAEWHYTVDRWVSFGAIVSPNSSGGINISKKDEADYFGFIQRTEILQSDCNGKSMTLSAKINGEVLSGTIIKDDTEQTVFAIGGSSDRFVISSYSNNGIKYTLIQFYGSKTYTIEWVKMEYGSTATPFIPPDPATELLKCMRYYEIIMSAGCDRAIPANLLSELKAEVDFQFTIPKRAVPSLATNTLRFVVATSTGYSTFNLSVQQHASDINGMCLNTVPTVLTELPTYLLDVTVDTWGLGAFAVDAEIY